jgi:hypothetical protein
MRISSYIFSVFFVALFGMLHVQPLFPKKEVKKEQTCARSKCQKQTEEPADNDNCRNEGCNPFVPCPMGSCCYLVENLHFPSSLIIISTQKIALVNDNRLLGSLSDCWHPPEMRS